MLTSTYPTDRILEVSDGRQTMSVAVAHVALFYRIVTRPTSRVETFGSQILVVPQHTTWTRFFSDTRNVIDILEMGEHDGFVTWQLFYTMPHVGQVRKEVCWRREELSQVLRATVVASRLTTQRHVEGRTA